MSEPPYAAPVVVYSDTDTSQMIPRRDQLTVSRADGSMRLGDGSTHFDDLDTLPSGGGGSPQIAAKSTDTTPGQDGDPAGPGLYASTSDAPEDGGWLTVDIRNTTDFTGVDLMLGETDGFSGLLDISLNKDSDGNRNAVIRGVGRDADSPGPGCRFQLEADGYNDGSGQGVVSVGSIDGSVRAALIYESTSQGAGLLVKALDAQSNPMIGIYRPDWSPLFLVDLNGPQMADADGVMWRLVVGTDGTLSTEAV